MRLTIHTQESAPATSRPVLAGIDADLGLVPNLTASIAESPVLVQGFDGLRRAVAGIDPIDREVAGLSTGVAVDNPLLRRGQRHRATLDNFQGFRSAKLARRDPTPRLVVTLSSGPYAIEQNDRLDRRRSGSMVAYWSRDQLRLQALEAVPLRGARPDGRLARRLDPDRAARPGRGRADRPRQRGAVS